MMCHNCVTSHVRLYTNQTNKAASNYMLLCLSCFEHKYGEQDHIRYKANSNQFVLPKGFHAALPKAAGEFYSIEEAAQDLESRKLLCDWLSEPHTGPTYLNQISQDLKEFAKDLAFQLKEETDPIKKDLLFDVILTILNKL